MGLRSSPTPQVAQRTLVGQRGLTAWTGDPAIQKQSNTTPLASARVASSSVRREHINLDYESIYSEVMTLRPSERYARVRQIWDVVEYASRKAGIPGLGSMHACENWEAALGVLVRRTKTHMLFPDDNYVPYVSPWVPAIEARRLVRLDNDGLPNVTLHYEDDEIVVRIPRGKLQTKIVALQNVGLFGGGIAGTAYYQKANKAADMTPGNTVFLVREPDCTSVDESGEVIAHPTAIQVRTRDGLHLGYIKSTQSRKLAPLMDEGQDYAGLVLRGAPAGKMLDDGYVPHILAGRKEVLNHLRRSLQLPPPID